MSEAMGKYASRTSVPVKNSQDEINRILSRYGAEGFGYYTRTDRAIVQFEIRTSGALRRVQITIIMPDPKSSEFTMSRHKNECDRHPVDDKTAHGRWEQACRQRWRALVLVIKAKLEAIDAQISTFEEEFLPFLVLPDGQTIGEKLLPQLKQLESGERALPRLVGGVEP